MILSPAGNLLAEHSCLVADAAQQILRHSTTDIRRRCVHLGMAAKYDSQDGTQLRDALHISKSLRAATVSMKMIALRILEFTSSDCFSGEDHERFRIIYTAFARDVIDVICIVGTSLNDFRAMAGSDWRESMTPISSEDRDELEVDLCQMLCEMIVDIGAEQRTLVPPLMVMLAERCEFMTRLAGSTKAAVLPAIFPEQGQGQEGQTTATFWGSSIAGVDDEYAAVSALGISCYLLYAFEQLLTMEHGAKEEGFCNGQ
ncbi:hypothetical protein HDU86_000316 [Geranomyces michiganensis]|nr:hypothetical protein HDU86_000316 [Geranomyces michiganensis]